MQGGVLGCFKGKIPSSIASRSKPNNIFLLAHAKLRKQEGFLSRLVSWLELRFGCISRQRLLPAFPRSPWCTARLPLTSVFLGVLIIDIGIERSHVKADYGFVILRSPRDDQKSNIAQIKSLDSIRANLFSEVQMRTFWYSPLLKAWFPASFAICPSLRASGDS